MRAVRGSPKPPPVRITLTLPTINTADEVWLIAAGAGQGRRGGHGAGRGGAGAAAGGRRARRRAAPSGCSTARPRRGPPNVPQPALADRAPLAPGCARAGSRGRTRRHARPNVNRAAPSDVAVRADVAPRSRLRPPHRRRMRPQRPYRRLGPPHSGEPPHGCARTLSSAADWPAPAQPAPTLLPVARARDVLPAHIRSWPACTRSGAGAEDTHAGSVLTRRGRRIERFTEASPSRGDLADRPVL